MKICFISPKAYPLFNPEIESVFGGAEVQISHLAKNIAKNKMVDCSIITADYGQGQKEVWDGVNIWKSFKLNDNIFLKINKLFKIFKTVDADVYIQRSLNFFSGIIALYFKARKKKFVYMAAHDDEFCKKGIFSNNKISFLVSSLVFRFADLLIVQNNFQKKMLEQKRYKPFLLRSSINISSVLDKKKHGVLWVGRSEEWKRPDMVLDLARILPDINFTMICPMATNNSALFSRIKNKAKFFNNIDFIDYVAYDRIDDYFLEALIYLNTSVNEGFPNTFLQAALAKTLIISTTVNPDGFLLDGRGVIAGEDMNEVANQIRKCHNDPAACGKIAMKAFDYVKFNHDVDKNSKKFTDELKKLNDK